MTLCLLPKQLFVIPTCTESSFGIFQLLLTRLRLRVLEPIRLHSPRSSRQSPSIAPFRGCPSKGFNRPYELARHMRKHTRTQVFPCPIGGCVCSRNDKAPYRRDKLQSHLRKAHGNYRVNGAAGSGAASQLAGHAGSSGSGLTVRGLLDTFCSPISASSTTRLTRLRSFF